MKYSDFLEKERSARMGRKKTAEEYNREYTGKVYGDVRIDEYSHRNKYGFAYFYCTCLRCGVKFGPVQLNHLKSGHTTSCGHCLERTEIGKRYGSYVIKEFHHKDKKSNIYFLCECDCGEERIVLLNNLKSGNTTSCGRCLERTEIGNRYGSYVIKEFHHRGKKGQLHFLCKCDCGNEGIVYLDNLKSGKTTSCGCRNESIGETNIKNILNENNISYECQKRFEDCKNTRMLPFDFYITYGGLEWCIEFDGEQHEKAVELYGGEEGFKNRQHNDQIKNQYCEDNNIPLIRIPYSKRDTMTIDDLMLDSSNYLWVKL